MLKRHAVEDIVIVTDRAQLEPVRTFQQQLRKLGLAPYTLQRVNYSTTQTVPPPQIIFVDADSSEYKTNKNITQSLRNALEAASLILFGSLDDIRGLHFGPNMHDFLSLPITLPELEARIRFAAWRVHSALPSYEMLEHSGLRMNLTTYEVWSENDQIALTYKEFELLRFFLRHPRRVFSRPELLETIWESDYYGGTRTVDVHIRRLREKIGEPYRDLIHTVRSVGYRFG